MNIARKEGRREGNQKTTYASASLSSPCKDDPFTIGYTLNIYNNNNINNYANALLCVELHGRVGCICGKCSFNCKLVIEQYSIKQPPLEKRVVCELASHYITDYYNKVLYMKAEIKNMEQAERLMNSVKAGHIEALPDGRVFLIFDEERG